MKYLINPRRLKPHGFKPFTSLGSGRQSGFSLVEVTLALGIVAYSMLLIVGVMPVGLQSMQQSAVQYGTAAIAQQISAELQEMPFTPPDDSASASSSYSIMALSTGAKKVEYYTRDGVITTDSATDVSAFPYFSATFSTSDASVPGATESYHSNLQEVRVTVSYPCQAPEASRQTNVLNFLVAKQNSL